MKFLKEFLALFLIGFVLSGPLSAASGTARSGNSISSTEGLEKTIVAEMASSKVPGAAIALIIGDKIVFAKGFGTTSVEGGSAVNPDTLFRIGSTTKMFTAAAFAEMTSRGRARFDAPVSTYIGDLSPKIGQLTAHQLLSQSSGLRDFAAPLVSDDDDALAKNVMKWKDDVFFTEPGKIYSYSSANYWLAGLLVEKINGKPYSDSMAELIFGPLGMTRTTLRPNMAMTYPVALGHANANGAMSIVRPIDNNVAKFPGGSMYSSVNELSRFAIAMLNGGTIAGKRVLSASVVENLQKPQFYLPGDGNMFYGYGLLGYDVRGVKTVSHGGVSRGYGSTIAFAPEHKFAIIVLTNSNGQTLPKTRQKALELFLPLKSGAGAAPVNREVSDDDIKRLVGAYAHAPQRWEVTSRDGKLFIKTDGKEFDLKKTSENEFSYEHGQVVFVPNGDGRIDHIFMGLYAARRVD